MATAAVISHSSTSGSSKCRGFWFPHLRLFGLAAPVSSSATPSTSSLAASRPTAWSHRTSKRSHISLPPQLAPSPKGPAHAFETCTPCPPDHHRSPTRRPRRHLDLHPDHDGLRIYQRRRLRRQNVHHHRQL